MISFNLLTNYNFLLEALAVVKKFPEAKLFWIGYKRNTPVLYLSRERGDRTARVFHYTPEGMVLQHYTASSAHSDHRWFDTRWAEALLDPATVNYSFVLGESIMCEPWEIKSIYTGAASAFQGAEAYMENQFKNRNTVFQNQKYSISRKEFMTLTCWTDPECYQFISVRVYPNNPC